MDKADEDHKAFTKAYTHQNYTSQVLKTLVHEMGFGVQ